MGGLALPSIPLPSQLLQPECPLPRGPMEPLAHSSPDRRPESPPMLSPSLSFSLARCLPPRSTSGKGYQTPVGTTQALRADVYPVGTTLMALWGHLFGLRTKLAQEWPYSHPTLGQPTVPGHTVQAPDLMTNLFSKHSFLLYDSSSQDVSVRNGLYGSLQQMTWKI